MIILQHEKKIEKACLLVSILTLVFDDEPLVVHEAVAPFFPLFPLV